MNLKINFKKVLLPGLLAVIVAAAAAWYGFQYFDDAGQKPQVTVAAKPAAKQKQKVAGPAPQPGKASGPKPAQVAGETKSEAPQPVSAEAERDKLIEDILTVSGFRQQMKQLPEIILAGARQSQMQQGANVAMTMPPMEKMIADYFKPENFNNSLTEHLNKQYDRDRYQSLIAMMSTPLSKRMTEYELQQPNPVEAQTFISGLVSNPMSAGRSALIKRVDAATKTSQIGAEIALTSIKSMALAAAGKDKVARENIETSIEKNKQKIADQVTNSSLITLAFLYRKASDEDLDAYAKSLESKDALWIRDVMYASLLDEFGKAFTRMGESIAAQMEANAGKGAPGMPGARGKSRANEDARECLKHADNEKIIRCSELYI